MLSPDDLQEIKELFETNGVMFPWWSYILTFVFTVCSIYSVTYLQTKGKDKATQENFDTVLEQLQETTRVAKEIETSLQRKNWLTQQQWSIREQHYTKLLHHLWILKLSLSKRLNFCDDVDSEYSDDDFKEFEKSGDKSYLAIEELIGIASLFLSDETIKTIEILFKEHSDVSEFKSADRDYISHSFDLVEDAYSSVLAEAKNGLTKWD